MSTIKIIATSKHEGGSRYRYKLRYTVSYRGGNEKEPIWYPQYGGTDLETHAAAITCLTKCLEADPESNYKIECSVSSDD